MTNNNGRQPAANGQLGPYRWNISPSRETIPAKKLNGYTFVLPREVSDAHLPMYRAMQKSGQPILSHRWAMAKHLGRPLTSNELVDHMNGDKTDWSIGNLRLYVRGKQQPGSAPGHGTYYHEWQLAESRIRELEQLLAG